MIKRRWSLILSLVALIASALIGLGLMQMAQMSSLESVQEKLAQLTPFATAIRLLLIVIIATLWGPITRTVAKRTGMDKDRQVELLAWRWRAVAWLIVLELILGQNILNRFITA